MKTKSITTLAVTALLALGLSSCGKAESYPYPKPRKETSQ